MIVFFHCFFCNCPRCPPGICICIIYVSIYICFEHVYISPWLFEYPGYFSCHGSEDEQCHEVNGLFDSQFLGKSVSWQQGLLGAVQKQ